MKNIILMTCLLTCLFAFNRCSDESYNERYIDPNKVTTLLMHNVLYGEFAKSQEWAWMGYGRYFTYDPMFLANFTQTFGYSYSGTMYHTAYDVDGKYSAFYASAAMFKTLESMYNNLLDAEKPSYKAYYFAAKTHIYGHMLSILDIYGDIPWKEACNVVTTGDLANSNAHFDHAEDLYEMIIDDLKEVGQDFATVTKPKDFTAHGDFVLQADFNKWQMYANSIRLRTALRVATQGVKSEKGRAAIKEILENPTVYPVVEKNEDNIAIVNQGAGPVNDGDAGRGLDDWGGSHIASGAVMNRTLSNYTKDNADLSQAWCGTYQDGVDDPRVAILYTMATRTPNKLCGDPTDPEIKNPERYEIPTVYRGATPEITQDEAIAYSEGANTSQLIKRGFFWNNNKFDHLIYTASETWFIKAEAYLLGLGVTKDEAKAKEAFKKGVALSIQMYYNYWKNKSNADETSTTSLHHYVNNPSEPTDAWLDSFAEARWNSSINATVPYDTNDGYNGHYDAIITQKWLSFSILFVREAWNEIRRTGYPSGLYFPTVNDQTLKTVPNRWRYPLSEQSLNKNFGDVNRSGFNADDYYTKLFWAK